MQKVTIMKMKKATELTQVHLAAAIKFYAVNTSKALLYKFAMNNCNVNKKQLSCKF